MEEINVPKRRGWLKLVGVATVALLSIWVVFYFIVTDIGPTASKEEKLRREIEAKGYFATLEGYEKMISVPSDQNAAGELAKILKELDKKNFDQESDEKFLALVKPRENAYQRLEKLVEKPKCVFDRDRSFAYNILFPELAPMKGLVKALCRQAKLEHKAGRSQIALRNWKIAAKIADYCDDEHTLIGQLLRIGNSRIIEKELRSADSVRPFSPTEAVAVLNILAPLDQPIEFAKAAKTEYWFTVSSYQHDSALFFGDRSALRMFEALKTLPKFREASLARVHESYLEFENNLNGEDLYAARSSFTKIEIAGAGKGMSYKYLDLMSPVFSQYTDALITNHNSTQKLFAWLESRAGKQSQRKNADGTAVK